MPERVDDRQGRTAGIEPILDIWARRKWIAIIVCAAVMTAAVSLTMSLPYLYRATTTVLVEQQQVSEAFVRPVVSTELESRIQMIQQEVMSRARLSELITRLNLYPELRRKGVSFDDIVDRMRRDVDLDPKGVDPAVSGRGPTIAFAISYTGRDPATVAEVTNTLASLYVEENTKSREGQAARTASFLQAQVTQARQDLDAQQRRIGEYQSSHIGELPQQVEANLASLERLNTQLRLNGENQIRVTDRRERLERQRADAQRPVAAPSPPAASPDAERISRLKTQLEESRHKFKDTYPDVRRLQEELAALERQSQKSATPAPSAAPAADPDAYLTQTIKAAEAELAALKQEELSLRRAIDAYQQRVENVPKRQEEFDALSRDYTSTKERYESLLKRYEDAQVAERLEQGRHVEQFRIIDPAIPPREPAAPGRLRLLAFGLVLAITLACAAALAAEKIDTAFHTVEDLRAFATVPAVFSIPVIRTAAATRRQWGRFALAVITIAIGLTCIAAASHYIANGNERIVRLTARGRV
ncbi:MAG: hypothetical protein DMF85_05145 [Acidobacteria bacterium]|nr:MAG: hypothetical protein DMF85_05145 [Acidobacteriota bacterium]